MHMFVFNGKEIETDSHGYLKNSNEWSEDMVPTLAKIEEIELTEQHWEIIRFVRQFYLEFNTSPAIRMLVKALAQNMAMKKVIAVTFIAYFLKAQRSKPQNWRVYLNPLNVFKN